MTPYELAMLSLALQARDAEGKEKLTTDYFDEAFDLLRACRSYIADQVARTSSRPIPKK